MVQGDHFQHAGQGEDKLWHLRGSPQTLTLAHIMSIHITLAEIVACPYLSAKEGNTPLGTQPKTQLNSIATKERENGFRESKRSLPRERKQSVTQGKMKEGNLDWKIGRTL